ncbi:MAG: glycosyltransferase family 4 protein [Nitrospirota bacterium]
MKIFHFIYDHVGNPWVAGGGAVRAREIGRRLAERHDVTIICGKYPGARDYEEGRLRFRFIGTKRDNYVLSTFCYAIKAAVFLLRHRGHADLVVEDFAPFNPVFSRFIAPEKATIQVHHREGANLFRRYFLLGLPFFLVEAFYPRLFRHSVSVSEASKRKFRLAGGVVISNGIDPSLLDAEHFDGRYVAYLGRLHVHNKGLDILAKAMRHVDTPLVIAGKGRDEEKLKALFRETGASGKVRFLGHVDDDGKKEFLSSSMFCVLPSRYEGQGIVVIEAAALGKPVVVSDIQELAFAVGAGFGLSFRTADARDLAEKMETLARDASLRRKMGEKAREFAQGCTWDRVAEEYEEYLLERTKEI